uniref:Large ribosomal subunit protein bL35c n=2 Tax=Grateloupia TaxID=31454 RepID=A0A6F8UPR0_9FLOR|nr:50S ribosomal protein L35 [Grateloupia filicina]AWD77436.1 50S ribosomal protein L35 [Grateloupia filicina]BCB15049.1 50S ribosomal protein L35 [Grateloupia asiatica]
MYKLKTSKSIVKRFKLTSRGKLLRHRASRNHLLQKKSAKRKQKLRQTTIVSKSDILNFKFKLSYFD